MGQKGSVTMITSEQPTGVISEVNRSNPLHKGEFEESVAL